MARRQKLSLRVGQPDDKDDYNDGGGDGDDDDDGNDGDGGGYDDDEKNVGTRMNTMIIIVVVYNEVLISDQDSCIDCNNTCPPTRDSSSSKAI